MKRRTSRTHDKLVFGVEDGKVAKLFSAKLRFTSLIPAASTPTTTPLERHAEGLIERAS
ncbi:hypothetical protein [Polaromonas sp. YR568]|uniref:hypothetical protein n=1 Tax=Polaromonas sp. YR568 TaxID=1855301 RepID=UPI00398BF6C5